MSINIELTSTVDESPLRVDTVEKLYNFQPGKITCDLTCLSINVRPVWEDCRLPQFSQRLLWADTVEKLQISRPNKTICVLSFLSNLTHGGDHINRDLFLQSHW